MKTYFYNKNGHPTCKTTIGVQRRRLCLVGVPDPEHKRKNAFRPSLDYFNCSFAYLLYHETPRVLIVADPINTSTTDWPWDGMFGIIIGVKNIMKKIILILSCGALVLPNIARACYLGLNYRNVFLSGLIGLAISIFLIMIIHRRMVKLFAKKYKYYILFIPIYIVITILLIAFFPLNKTTVECGGFTGDPHLPSTFENLIDQ